MRIDEFTNKDNFSLPFDLADDTVVFMRNDPIFYRKFYYPAMIELAKHIKSGDKVSANKSILPIVDSGIDQYCKKFDLAKNPTDIFKKEDKEAIIKRILSDEIANIKKGDYK